MDDLSEDEVMRLTRELERNRQSQARKGRAGQTC